LCTGLQALQTFCEQIVAVAGGYDDGEEGQGGIRN
jgi:hypothetical protein